VLRLIHTTATSPFSFSKFLIYSGKQGSGATVLGGGVAGGTCDPYSLNINILGKAVVLHFAFTLFCSWSRAKSAYRFLGIAVLVSSSHKFSKSQCFLDKKLYTLLSWPTLILFF
jgi:hypothetical protein